MTKPRVSAKGRRIKGSKFERELAKELGGRRVPLSGALGKMHSDFAEDVELPNGQRIQCKCVHNGWITLRRLLDTADILALKPDGEDPLIVMRLLTFKKYATGELQCSVLL